MEKKETLHRLMEAADLIGMLEDMLNPETMRRLSASSWSGIRLTLKNIKDDIQLGYSFLSTEATAESAEAHVVKRAPVDEEVNYKRSESTGLSVQAGVRVLTRIEERSPLVQYARTQAEPTLKMTCREIRPAIQKLSR